MNINQNHSINFSEKKFNDRFFKVKEFFKKSKNKTIEFVRGNKKPIGITFFALGIILIGFFAIKWFIEPTQIPSEVRISNKTDSGFTVSWVTKGKPTKGSVYVYKDGGMWLPVISTFFGQRTTDERDNLAKEWWNTRDGGRYITHYVNVNNLEPDTLYTLKIRVGNKLYTVNSEQEDISWVRTYPNLTDSKYPDTTYGYINASNTGIAGSIVYVKLIDANNKSSNLLSGLANEEGMYWFDKAVARNTEGDKLFDYTESKEVIAIEAGDINGKIIVVDQSDNKPAGTVGLEVNDKIPVYSKQPIEKIEEKERDIYAMLGNKFDVSASSNQDKLLNPAGFPDITSIDEKIGITIFVLISFGIIISLKKKQLIKSFRFVITGVLFVQMMQFVPILTYFKPTQVSAYSDSNYGINNYIEEEEEKPEKNKATEDLEKYAEIEDKEDIEEEEVDEEEIKVIEKVKEIEKAEEVPQSQDYGGSTTECEKGDTKEEFNGTTVDAYVCAGGKWTRESRTQVKKVEKEEEESEDKELKVMNKENYPTSVQKESELKTLYSAILCSECSNEADEESCKKYCTKDKEIAKDLNDNACGGAGAHDASLRCEQESSGLKNINQSIQEKELTKDETGQATADEAAIYAEQQRVNLLANTDADMDGVMAYYDCDDTNPGIWRQDQCNVTSGTKMCEADKECPTGYMCKKIVEGYVHECVLKSKSDEGEKCEINMDCIDGFLCFNGVCTEQGLAEAKSGIYSEEIEAWRQNCINTSADAYEAYKCNQGIYTASSLDQYSSLSVPCVNSAQPNDCDGDGILDQVELYTGFNPYINEYDECVRSGMESFYYGGFSGYSEEEVRSMIGQQCTIDTSENGLFQNLILEGFENIDLCLSDIDKMQFDELGCAELIRRIADQGAQAEEIIDFLPWGGVARQMLCESDIASDECEKLDNANTALSEVTGLPSLIIDTGDWYNYSYEISGEDYQKLIEALKERGYLPTDYEGIDETEMKNMLLLWTSEYGIVDPSQITVPEEFSQERELALAIHAYNQCLLDPFSDQCKHMVTEDEYLVSSFAYNSRIEKDLATTIELVFGVMDIGDVAGIVDLAGRAAIMVILRNAVGDTLTEEAGERIVARLLAEAVEEAGEGADREAIQAAFERAARGEFGDGGNELVYAVNWENVDALTTNARSNADNVGISGGSTTNPIKLVDEACISFVKENDLIRSVYAQTFCKKLGQDYRSFNTKERKTLLPGSESTTFVKAGKHGDLDVGFVPLDNAEQRVAGAVDGVSVVDFPGGRVLSDKDKILKVGKFADYVAGYHPSMSSFPAWVNKGRMNILKIKQGREVGTFAVHRVAPTSKNDVVIELVASHDAMDIAFISDGKGGWSAVFIGGGNSKTQITLKANKRAFERTLDTYDQKLLEIKPINIEDTDIDVVSIYGLAVRGKKTPHSIDVSTPTNYAILHTNSDAFVFSLSDWMIDERGVAQEFQVNIKNALAKLRAGEDPETVYKALMKKLQELSRKAEDDATITGTFVNYQKVTGSSSVSSSQNRLSTTSQQVLSNASAVGTTRVRTNFGIFDISSNTVSYNGKAYVGNDKFESINFTFEKPSDWSIYLIKKSDGSYTLRTFTYKNNQRYRVDIPLSSDQVKKLTSSGGEIFDKDISVVNAAGQTEIFQPITGETLFPTTEQIDTGMYVYVTGALDGGFSPFDANSLDTVLIETIPLKSINTYQRASTYNIKTGENLIKIGIQKGDGESIVKDTKNAVDAEYSPSETDGLTTINYQLFWDNNKNGVQDGNEEFVSLSGVGIVNTFEQTYLDYDLSTGWNLIAFPYLNTSLTANDLINMIEQEDGYATTVAKYEGGRWVVFKVRGGDTYSEDFSIEPGKGYFIRVEKPVSISLGGYAQNSSTPIQTEIGWNLVGFAPGVTEEGVFQWEHEITEWTAEKVLSTLQAEGIKADVITRYKDGGYKNLVFENNVTYGEDYAIFPQEGYFIRVTEKNKDKWKP